MLYVAEKSGSLCIVCCAINAVSGTLIGWCYGFGGLALLASGRLSRCIGLALGFLPVADIVRIIGCIAASSAGHAIGCTDGVLVTLRLEDVSNANSSGNRPTYRRKRRDLGLSTGVGRGLIDCNGTG